MPDPIIEAVGLTRTYGDFKAVDDISFNIFGGEIVGFLGPNGAGKTTTIKLLTGLLQPTAGTARLAGHDIQSEAMAAKACLGYVPDTPNLYGKLKATEYLRFMGQLYKVPTDVVEDRIKRMLDLLELSRCLWQLPG